MLRRKPKKREFVITLMTSHPGRGTVVTNTFWGTWRGGGSWLECYQGIRDSAIEEWKAMGTDVNEESIVTSFFAME